MKPFKKVFGKEKPEPVEKTGAQAEKTEKEPAEKAVTGLGKSKRDKPTKKSIFSKRTEPREDKSIISGSEDDDSNPSKFSKPSKLVIGQNPGSKSESKLIVGDYSADPPDFNVGHFTVTLDDLANATGAAKAHQAGITGKGVRVAIVDSGYFPHKYFLEKYPKAKIQVQRLQVEKWKGGDLISPPGKEGEDLNGHGTAMVANVLAMAPDAEITMIVCSSDIQALDHAFSLKPHVISFSRGPTYGGGKGASNDPPARSVVIDDYQAVIEKGMKASEQAPVILDAVGNMGARGMLSLLPDVISVGGTYMDEKGNLSASDYTNAYTVPGDIYLTPAERKTGSSDVNLVAKTQLPEITGLCGTAAHPDYIALPTQPGSELENKRTPGWGLASGSSCATPQVAGACVLLKQMKPNLTTRQALAALQVTGKQVTQGHGHVDQVNTGTGVQAIPGSGLQADGKWSRFIDVGAAVNLLSSPPQGATPEDLMTALSLWHSGGNQTPQSFQGILNIVAKHTAVITNQDGQ